MLSLNTRTEYAFIITGLCNRENATDSKQEFAKQEASETLKSSISRFTYIPSQTKDMMIMVTDLLTVFKTQKR